MFSRKYRIIEVTYSYHIIDVPLCIRVFQMTLVACYGGMSWCAGTWRAMTKDKDELMTERSAMEVMEGLVEEGYDVNRLKKAYRRLAIKCALGSHDTQ